MGVEGGRGSLEGAGVTVGVIWARYNEPIVSELLGAALEALEEHGATAEPVLSVPGSFELPLAARALSETGAVDAVVCLGCIVRGDTAHFEHVAQAAARGILDVGLETGVPCVFGVLTTYTEAQARERLDKGREAAETAIEMANLLRDFR